MTCRDPSLTSHWPPRTTHWPPMTPHWPLRTPHWPPRTPTDLTGPPIDLPWSPMSFSTSFFFPQNFTPRDAHCCWQWASKNLSFLIIQVLSSLCNILQVSLNPPSSGFVCAGTLYPAIGYHPSIKSDMRQHLYFLRCFSIFSIKWAQKPYLFWFTRHMHFFMT